MYAPTTSLGIYWNNTDISADSIKKRNFQHYIRIHYKSDELKTKCKEKKYLFIYFSFIEFEKTLQENVYKEKMWVNIDIKNFTNWKETLRKAATVKETSLRIAKDTLKHFSIQSIFQIKSKKESNNKSSCKNIYSDV